MVAIAVWPIVLFAALGIALPIGILLLVRGVARRAVAAASADPALAGALVTAPALYGGGDGVGLPVVHGTGALGLTRGPLGDELVFVLAVPRREIRVAAGSLIGATVERALRLPGVYRRNRHPWLVVRWTHPSGVPCVAGFAVADPQRWAEVLDAAVRSRATAPPPPSPPPAGG